VSFPPFPQRSLFAGPGPAAKPGIIPLRPLSAREILAAAVVVVRRHLLPLAATSLAISAIGGLAVWGLLAATGQVDSYLSGAWLTPVLDGTATGIPAGIVAATVVSLVVSVTGGVLTAGLATVCAAQETLGRRTRRVDWVDRLARRWPLLLTLSLLLAVAVSVGLVLFIIPGVLTYLAYLVASPVAVLERGGIGESLRRSALLTTGERTRLLGLVAAVLAVTVLLNAFITSLLGDVLGQLTTTAALLVSEAVAAVVSMFTVAWAGAVSAIAYIDLRIRKENLAPTLAAAATA